MEKLVKTDWLNNSDIVKNHGMKYKTDEEYCEECKQVTLRLLRPQHKRYYNKATDCIKCIQKEIDNQFSNNYRVPLSRENTNNKLKTSRMYFESNNRIRAYTDKKYSDFKPLMLHDATLKQAISDSKDLKKRILDGDYTSVMIHGGNGCGKTHLAFAMINEILDEHEKQGNKKILKIICISWLQFRQEMKNGFNDNGSNSSTILDQCKKADILLLDNIGGEETKSDFFTERLSELLDARVGIKGKVTIFTTLYKSDELNKRYDRQGRIISKIRENLKYIEMEGIDDYRKKLVLD